MKTKSIRRNVIVISFLTVLFFAAASAFGQNGSATSQNKDKVNRANVWNSEKNTFDIKI